MLRTAAVALTEPPRRFTGTHAARPSPPAGLPGPAPGAAVFRTVKLDEAHTLLQAHYTTLRLNPIGERVGLRIAQDRLGPIRLDRISFAMSAEIDADPLGSWCIAGVRHGRITLRHHHEEIVCRPGDVVLAAQPNSAWAARLDDLDADLVLIDPRLLAETAQAATGQPPRLIGPTTASAGAAKYWWRTYNYLHTLATTPPVPNDDLIVRTATRLLAATTLAVFPHTALNDPSSQTSADHHDARSETLRRATAFIEANPHRDIRITDIANAACVSVRAVQLAFRRHLDTTPMAHLRKVRLHLAHHELLAADPTTASVTAVAAHWGFLNPSHFASLYRHEFGRAPSQTLRR
jgi:AraC-like DNA-binding protein